MIYQGKNSEYFEVVSISKENCFVLKNSRQSELSMLWSDSDDNRLIIDSREYKFNTDDLIFITEFHKVEVKHIDKLRLLRFNRPFYCVLDHDSEVSCKGVLFYGASNLPIVQPESQELKILEAALHMLELEMTSVDNLQLEMLQMMLKRILILCTRVYKNQLNYSSLDIAKGDILRDFNFLVEQHFQEKHKVSDYATMLNRTPKSISNLFKKISDKTPLQVIQDRRMLEARRMLRYSKKSVSDIGYDLGFLDVQSFSRFFKNKEGVNPKEFREISD